MMNNSLAIDVKNLSKSFGDKPAVRGISLQVKCGEIFGFMGPNGSGKTTTIRMLCGLLTPDSAEGQCLGFDVLTGSMAIREHVGYMTQFFSLYDDLTISENLDFIAHLYQVVDRKKAVADMIASFGLTQRAKQIVGTLSGGWKQRLSLAAALLHRPQLLLLDEPTAGVDPQSRREFWNQISALSAEGVTTLVSTHYMDEAERCHRLGYIFNGKILACGSKDEIISASGLKTWAISNHDATITTEQLRNLPGVEQVVAFGRELHVSGKDDTLLSSSLSQFSDCKRTPIIPSLEEVFISIAKGNSTIDGN